MVPLVLGGVGLVWSEKYGGDVGYLYRNTHYVRCGTSCGHVWLRWGQNANLGFGSGSLAYRSWPIDEWEDHSLPGETAWLGFRFWHLEAASNKVRMLQAPYWFLLIVSALLLGLAWRATRPRQGGGQGFPVEVAREEKP